MTFHEWIERQTWQFWVSLALVLGIIGSILYFKIGISARTTFDVIITFFQLINLFASFIASIIAILTYYRDRKDDQLLELYEAVYNEIYEIDTEIVQSRKRKRIKRRTFGNLRLSGPIIGNPTIGNFGSYELKEIILADIGHVVVEDKLPHDEEGYRTVWTTFNYTQRLIFPTELSEKLDNYASKLDKLDNLPDVNEFEDELQVYYEILKQVLPSGMIRLEDGEPVLSAPKESPLDSIPLWKFFYYSYPVLTHASPWEGRFRKYVSHNGYSNRIFNYWDEEYPGWDFDFRYVYQDGYFWYTETDKETIPNDLTRKCLHIEALQARYDSWEEMELDEIELDGIFDGSDRKYETDAQIQKNIQQRWALHRDIVELAIEIKEELEHRITELA